MTEALAALEAQAARDITYVDYPSYDWVPPRRHASGARVLDVVIVGGGMNGLSVAFRLLRERITNILVIDRNTVGYEGPWVTYARMQRLRTPKELVGPDCGFPSLSFQAWYRALYGEAAWKSLDKAPCDVWMDYLNWFRRQAAIPIDNEVILERIDPEPEALLGLRVSHAGRQETLYARKVVLATGILGAGGGNIPDVVRRALPPNRYAHSADDIDFAALRGRRVAVLGAGASAFDNAAAALEAGAAEVHLFAHRATIDKLNIKERPEFSTLLRYYGDLDDDCRWRLMRMATNDTPPPPRESVARCTRHVSFHIHAGARLSGPCMDGDDIVFAFPDGPHRCDFLILGTGFLSDVSQRSELEALADRILLWRNVYKPPPAEEDELLGSFPYLGPSFEYLGKRSGEAPYLANLYEFGPAAVQSMGPICVGLNGMKIGVPRLVSGIARSLFLEDADSHELSLIRAVQRGRIGQ